MIEMTLDVYEVEVTYVSPVYSGSHTVRHPPTLRESVARQLAAGFIELAEKQHPRQTADLIYSVRLLRNGVQV